MLCIYLFIYGLSFSTIKVTSRQGKWGLGPKPLVERFVFTMQASKIMRQQRAFRYTVITLKCSVKVSCAGYHLSISLLVLQISN